MFIAIGHYALACRSRCLSLGRADSSFPEPKVVTGKGAVSPLRLRDLWLRQNRIRPSERCHLWKLRCTASSLGSMVTFVDQADDVVVLLRRFAINLHRPC